MDQYCVQLFDFLPIAEHDRLLSFTLEQQPNFTPTTTSTGDRNYRNSLVLHHFSEFAESMRGHVLRMLPYVSIALGTEELLVQEVEAQLTAHNNGSFYKLHNDNGSPDTATRRLTYVYYFNRSPKVFNGGMLKIHDSEIRDSRYVMSDRFQLVEPVDNSIVFFLSHHLHEVLPVDCISQEFGDSRFTINGWVRGY